MPDNFLDSVNLETEGYEDPMGEDGNSEHFAFFNSDEIQSKEGITKTGKEMSSHIASYISGDGVKKEMFFGKDRKIFGLPFKYSQLADPLSRVYQATFETDNTCVAFIKFGIPKINRLLYQKMSADSNDSPSAGLNIFYGLRSAISPTESAQDQRLITFVPAAGTFMKYATASINQLYTLLDLPGIFSPDGYDDFNGNGFAFYCVKTGAFNEGVNNEYTVPDVIDKMNSDAAIKRQNYQLYGTYGHVNTDSQGTATSWLNNIITSVGEKIKENIANAPIIGSVASVFMKSNKGSMSYYGKVWADSKTECSYSLSFKFRSPYGSKFEIFRNVFFPFLLLHTAAIPKQDGRFSYQEPFMVMIDFPGWFRVNCGVITQLSWVKGGDTQLWNVDGLPLEMTVTMQVEDLYPIQLASENVTVMEYNWGLLSFLENMAGLSVSQVASLNPYSSYANNLRLKMGESDGSIGGNLKAMANAKYKSMTNKVKNFVNNPVSSITDNFSYLGGRPGSTTNLFR